MTYFELLEQDTNNPEIQFALYKACLAGEDEGTDNAETWLKAAAKSGHEEAIKILSEQKAPEKNSTKQDFDYSQMPLKELFRCYTNNYAAAKEFINRIKNDINTEEKKVYYEVLCGFEEASVEDYESLMDAYYDLGQFKSCLDACKNAIELGSNYGRKRLIELELFFARTDNTAINENVIYEFAAKGTLTEKVFAYILLNFEQIDFRDLTINKMLIWEEVQPFISKYPVLMKLLSNSNDCDLFEYVLSDGPDRQEQGFIIYYLFLQSKILWKLNQLNELNDKAKISANDLLDYKQFIPVIKKYNLTENCFPFDSLSVEVLSSFLDDISNKYEEQKAAYNNNVYNDWCNEKNKLLCQLGEWKKIKKQLLKKLLIYISLPFLDTIAAILITALSILVEKYGNPPYLLLILLLAVILFIPSIIFAVVKGVSVSNKLNEANLYIKKIKKSLIDVENNYHQKMI